VSNVDGDTVPEPASVGPPCARPLSGSAVGVRRGVGPVGSGGAQPPWFGPPGGVRL